MMLEGGLRGHEGSRKEPEGVSKRDLMGRIDGGSKEPERDLRKA